MLKKIMKAALAASLVFSFSAVAMAEAKVSGDVKAYYGQYNSGADDYTAHFATASEAHVNITGKSGPISAFLQYESRGDASTKESITATDGTTFYTSGSGNNINNSQLQVKYTAGMLSVGIGTVVTPAGCTYAISSGLKTTTTGGYGTYVACLAYFEQDGIQVIYVVPAIKGYVGLTIAPTTTASKMHINVNGVAGPAQFSVGQTMVTNDDVADADDSTTSDTATHIGVKVPFGTMSVSVDSSSYALDGGSGAGQSDLALQFRAGKVGPGTVIVTYATKDYTLDGTSYKKGTNTGLVYNIPMGKGVGADFFYVSAGSTPEGGDTTTKSWMGGGLTAGF